MTTLADSLRDRLDQPRIREQADFVAFTVFALARPAFLPYTPGNSTCYQLLFTPVLPSPGLEWYAPEGTIAYKPDSGDWLIVSWLEHGAYLFNFANGPPPVAGYIVEKLDPRATLADGIALHELFTAIQEAT